jgi:hypothetical protein
MSRQAEDSQSDSGNHLATASMKTWRGSAPDLFLSGTSRAPARQALLAAQTIGWSTVKFIDGSQQQKAARR